MYYFLIYAASLLLSLMLTSLVIWLGKRLKLADGTNVRKIHRIPVPRIGGVAVYISAFSVALLVLSLSSRTEDETLTKMYVLALGATIVSFLGLADDIKSLRARLKLFVQLAAATLVYGGGIRVGSIAVAEWSPIDLQWFAWPLTVLWIVGITNAVNLSDGLDGLATVLSMIACAVIMLLAFTSDQTSIAVLMLAMLGALAGFLWFNFHPARVFLGDSGSLLLGFVISVSSVLCFMKSHAFVGLALPAVALGIPITDTLLSMLRRFVARRPIFAPDRGHVHHRLLQLGLGQRQVLGVVCAPTLLLTALGMLMFSVNAWTSLILFAGIFVLLLALFYVTGVVRGHTVITGLRRRIHLNQQARAEIRRFCHLQLHFERARSATAWWRAICRTADQLDFAWALMSATDHEGNVETYLWRRPGTFPTAARVTTIRVPLKAPPQQRSIEVEVAVLTDGSVESAVRRASLFGRLLDEHGMPRPHKRAKHPASAMLNAPVKATSPHRRPLPTTNRLGSMGDAPRRLGSRKVLHDDRTTTTKVGGAS